MIRCLRNRPYFATLSERLGSAPPLTVQTESGGVWLHAISVGEVNSAVGWIRELRARRPWVAVHVSVGTLAGHGLAVNRLAGLADSIFYAPFDYVWCVRRVLRRLRPALVVVLETEIWPNFWRESRRSGASLLVVNGRISDRAYPRYRRFRWFFHAILQEPNLILAQTAPWRDRYLALGAPSAEIGGNLKYDFTPGEAPRAVVEFLEKTKPSKVLIAASTMPPAHSGDIDEDEMILDAWPSFARPGLLLILVPRRPERFATASASLERRKIPHVRRSALGDLPLPGVLLLDSIGELASLFRLADAVFMGGTVAERGGHNILEPALFGKPILSGPNLQNFPDIAEDFRDAIVRVTPQSFAESVRRILDDPQDFGLRAQALARARTGATVRAVEAAVRLHDSSLPRALPNPLLSMLATLWEIGDRQLFRRVKPRTAPKPVISIGNITLGGAGKTLFALYLAKVLQNQGRSPAFLTRGYKRQSHEMVTLLEPGASAPISLTGDEPQILLRSGLGPVGIAADRYAACLGLSKQTRAEIFILDDGFQHWKLNRNLDIVLIDVLDPFGGFAVVPHGRLREPLAGLRRAHAFVLTRTQPGRRYPAIEAELRRHHPEAPIFRSSLVPISWVNAASGAELPLDALQSKSPAAFCGLGNPDSFWASLKSLGVAPARQIAFPDHHRYRAADLRRLASYRPDSYVTTQKDLMNLSRPEALQPLYWLNVAVEMEQELEFAIWLEDAMLL